MSPSVEPFDEAKYKALMDGLECSEIRLSMINKDFRIDSEYQQKIYLFDDYYLNRKNAKPIDCFVTDGQHGYHEVDDNSSIHMLTAKNTKDWFADTIGSDLIAKWVDDNNKRSSLHENDLVLSTRGSVGYCAIVKSDILPANIDQDVARIKILDCSFRPEYVLTYLNSHYGQNWMKRNQTGMVQQGLSLQKVREIPIPGLINSFQEIIASVVTDAYVKKMQSQECIKNADKIFTETINLNMPSDSNTSKTIKTINDSFKVSGRLDAEYYQPKYDVLFNKLSEFSTANLGGKNGLVEITKSIEPGSEYYQEEGIPFIRVSDIDKFEIGEPNIKLPQDIVENAESLYPQKDTILFSKDGSVGIAHKVQEDMKAITSSALLHLTIKNTDVILPDYLTIVLNSPIVQLQAERDTNGAIIQHWKPSDIEKVVIPILDMDVQKEISEKVQESFESRKESKRMLECAVKAVEMAIELDEHTATRWLEQELEVF